MKKGDEGVREGGEVKRGEGGREGYCDKTLLPTGICISRNTPM